MTPSEKISTAIRNAEGIVMGPGSLYTSILPNLLIEDISNALAETNVPKIYVCNVMTQPHETDHFSAFDHVNAIIQHTRPEVLTHAIVNTGNIPQNMLAKYAKEEAYPVAADLAVTSRSQQFATFQSDAPACDNCGAITVRNGNCYLCHNCGASMGCS